MSPRRCSLLALALAACGAAPAPSSPDAAPDAPIAAADAAVDAAPDAPVRGPVTLTILAGTAPVSDAIVVFSEPGGRAVEVRTGADGAATADVAAGSAVTYVEGSALETLLDVGPGDGLTIVRPGASSRLGIMYFMPPAGQTTGFFRLFGPCGSGDGSTLAIGLVEYTDCALDPMEIVGVHYPEGAGVPDAALDLTGVAFAANTTTPLPAAWTALDTLSLSYAHADAVTAAQAEVWVPDRRGFEVTATPATPIGAATVSVRVPPASGALVDTTFTFAAGTLEVIDHVVGAPTAYALDLAQVDLPALAPALYDRLDATIVVPPTTGDADAFGVELSYGRHDVDRGSGFATYDWTIWGPRARDIALPALPADLADHAPTATDHVYGLTSTLVELDTVDGYGALKKDLDETIARHRAGRAPGRLRVRTLKTDGEAAFP